MEQIYTIPVNEAFEKGAADKSRGCPFCRLRAELCSNEIDLILGASVMDPETRKKTNEKGFCREHYGDLLSAGKRLPLALLLESHLKKVTEMIKKPVISPSAAENSSAKHIDRLSSSCYICERAEGYLSKMIDTAVILWDRDEAFRQKCSAQPFFCINHFARLAAAGKEKLDKKTFAAFYKELFSKEKAAAEKMCDDVSFFVRKFDYRFGDEPWNGRENAPEAAIDFICGDRGLK